VDAFQTQEELDSLVDLGYGLQAQNTKSSWTVTDMIKDNQMASLILSTPYGYFFQVIIWVCHSSAICSSLSTEKKSGKSEREKG
jgi:hypothetical protein